jgi:hypothetical protein
MAKQYESEIIAIEKTSGVASGKKQRPIALELS